MLYPRGILLVRLHSTSVLSAALVRLRDKVPSRAHDHLWPEHMPGREVLVRAPADPQRSGGNLTFCIRAIRFERDCQALSGFREWTMFYVRTSKILRWIVFGAPVSGLGADNEFGALFSGHHEQCVLAPGHIQISETDIEVENEPCRPVGPQSPHRVVGDEAAKDRPTPCMWLAVVDGDARGTGMRGGAGEPAAAREYATVEGDAGRDPSAGCHVRTRAGFLSGCSSGKQYCSRHGQPEHAL